MNDKDGLGSEGILVFGAAGSGTTTLARVMSKKLHYPHYDLDDYLWDWNTPIPFSKIRPRQQRIDLLMKDITQYPHFVMSGSMDSYNTPFLPFFEMAVFASAPTEIRLQRVHQRELNLFGKRILKGGDMALNHQKFLMDVASYEDNDGSPSRSFHQQWAESLPCKVIAIDTTLPIEDNVKTILEHYEKIIQKK